MFADDQVIISESENTLQRALHELNKIILDFNFEISIQKTKKYGILYKWPVRSILTLDNQPIGQVSRVNCHGCQLSCQDEFDHKSEKFNYICGTIKRTLKNKTRIETQIKFYEVMVVSTGLYGSENWVLIEKDKNRIQAAEMRFLRATLGVTRRQIN
jgi:hypothetical protein